MRIGSLDATAPLTATWKSEEEGGEHVQLLQGCLKKDYQGTGMIHPPK